MKRIGTICVFGDSTAWGAWDMEKGGWVNRLWLYVSEKSEKKLELKKFCKTCKKHTLHKEGRKG